MGPLSQPPSGKQLARLRGALAVSLALNVLALGLLAARPNPPVASPTPPGGGPTPSATPPVSIGPLVPGGGTQAAAGAPTAGGPAPSPTPVRVAHPGGKIRGVNIPVWGPDFAVADPSIRGAAALDANWVALVSHWYVSSAVPYSGGGIFQETNQTGKGEERSATDSSLGDAIDAAHAVGLKVLLKPHVDWTDGGWRGSFFFDEAKAPGGRDNWWSSYRALITDTVHLAMAHNAEGICIGTEFADINKEPGSASQWIHIINDIRGMGYAGKLTYAANWGLGADAEYNRPGLTGVWDLLDFIGVDAYYPISSERDPSLQALTSGWRTPLNQWDRGPYQELETLHKRTGKPVVFTEVGYPAVDYAAKDPCCEATGPENEALQSRAAAAVYQVWGDVPWWGGALWWQFGPSYNTHSLQGRQILDTLRDTWARAAVSAGP
jgi:hypothetical protein